MKNLHKILLIFLIRRRPRPKVNKESVKELEERIKDYKT